MEQLQYAGEFNLDHLEIIASSGVAVNISQGCLEINIFEDIFKHSLTGQLLVADVNNLKENMPFIGQEQLLMKISTPTLKGEDTVIDFTENALSIYNVSSIVDISTGATSYTMEFCSQELLRNNRVRISKSYVDTPSTIVENVLTDSRFINTKKSINKEITGGIRNIIVPNQRPFDFITNLTRESKSKTDGNPHYLFYETTRGYNFRTLQNLYKQPIKGSYNNGDRTDEEKPGEGLGIQQAYDRVVDYEIKGSNDALMDSRGGLLGAKLISYNIHNKSFDVNTYGYFENFDDHARINSNPKYNENLGDFTDSRIYVHPTSASGNLNAQYVNSENSNNSVVANKINETLLQKNARIHELNFGTTVVITVHGTTRLAAGDMIDLNFSPTGKKHGNSEKDKYVSGTYIATKLRHTFSPATRNHQVAMVLAKDSLPESLEIIANVGEIKSQGNATINDIT